MIDGFKGVAGFDASGFSGTACINSVDKSGTARANQVQSTHIGRFFFAKLSTGLQIKLLPLKIEGDDVLPQKTQTKRGQSARILDGRSNESSVVVRPDRHVIYSNTGGLDWRAGDCCRKKCVNV